MIAGGPCEAFTSDEQQRADGLGARCVEIASTPGHPSRGSLPHYQVAYRAASRTAAEHTSQLAADA